MRQIFDLGHTFGQGTGSWNGRLIRSGITTVGHETSQDQNESESSHGISLGSMNDVVALEGVSLSRDMNLFNVSIAEDQANDLVVTQLAHQEVGTTVD